jgi:hypothetical protein
MSQRPIDRENPDRLYTVTRGTSQADGYEIDLVTLIVSERDPVRGMQSEHARILQMCRFPTAVVEISSALELPVGVVRILLRDLLDSGSVTARHPVTPAAQAELPDRETLRQVLVGLHKL